MFRPESFISRLASGLCLSGRKRRFFCLPAEAEIFHFCARVVYQSPALLSDRQVRSNQGAFVHSLSPSCLGLLAQSPHQSHQELLTLAPLLVE